MSEFHVEAVRLGDINRHPNADSLGITQVRGYPVVVRLGSYTPGDIVAYLPVDSVAPNTEEFAFLGENKRVRAKKLRGVFSMGLLAKAPPDAVEGEDLAERMGVTKYEAPVGYMGRGLDEQDHGYMPVYTDIEGLRRYPGLLVDGENVVVTEKIHGENFRARFCEGQLWVGSRTRVKKRAESVKWWAAALTAGLEERLTPYPWAVVFGESHGYTGGFPYGVAGVPTLRVFDIFDTRAGKYMDHAAAVELAATIGLSWVPVLYAGPYSRATMDTLSEGKSTLDGSHCREGVVIRPVTERWDETVGRVILKLHGETFLLKA